MCVPEARVPRTGLGFDVHRFATGRELWLGGVRFEGEDGLMGHSDGDTVCHAVADALLGASALGDVGEHFPDSDTTTEGISGLFMTKDQRIWTGGTLRDLDGKVLGRLSGPGTAGAHGVTATDSGDVYLAQLSGVVQKFVKQ